MVKKLFSALPDGPLCDLWPQLGEAGVLNRTNNCYSYAVGTLASITDSKSRAHAQATPQPGDRSGVPKAVLLLLAYRGLSFWVKLAQRDGLRLLALAPDAPLPELPEGERLVALTYTAEYSDYHWLRREANGLWTHKPDSGRPPSWFDSNRQYISDPRRAEYSFAYRDFAFFAVPQAGIDVRLPKAWLKFFDAVDEVNLGNYPALRRHLRQLAALVQREFPVLHDYLEDLARKGDDSELRHFWKAFQEGKRLPAADGLMHPAHAHAPLGLAWQALNPSR